MMNKEALLAAVIALILGLGGGFGLAQVINNDDDTAESSSETTESHDDMAMEHAHSMYEVSAEDAPTVKVMVEEDAKSGFNVHIMTTDYKFTPENVNGENVANEGHAHLYVDGEKIARIYGNYYHFDESFDGTKVFKVTLNANDHSEYAVDGVVIADEVEVTHDHETMPHADDSDTESHDDMHM